MSRNKKTVIGAIFIAILAIALYFLYQMFFTPTSTLYYQPIQCNGNSWEQEWKQNHPNESYPSTPEQQNNVLTSYFKTHYNVNIISVTKKEAVGMVTCAACDCPTNYQLQVTVHQKDVTPLLNLGFKPAP